MENRIVCSVKGHDKGLYYAVISECEHGLLLADGKHHKLEKPKCKNKKHVVFTEYLIKEEALLSNKSLRRAIACYRADDLQVEELICQKKI